MALDKTKLDITASGSKGTKLVGAYETPDAKATVKAANYFNGAANELARVGLITIFASDATFQAKVSISGSTVTIAAPDTYA